MVRVRFTFVPAHCGIQNNETADELATEGAADGIPVQCQTTLSTYKQLIRKRTTYELDRYLREEVTDSNVSKTYPSRNPFKGRQLPGVKLKDDRWEYKDRSIAYNHILFRARTGHTRTNDHLQRVGIVESTRCRHCHNERESVLHLAMECEALIEDDTAAAMLLREIRQQVSLRLGPRINDETDIKKFNAFLWNQPNAEVY